MEWVQLKHCMWHMLRKVSASPVLGSLAHTDTDGFDLQSQSHLIERAEHCANKAPRRKNIYINIELKKYN